MAQEPTIPQIINFIAPLASVLKRNKYSLQNALNNGVLDNTVPNKILIAQNIMLPIFTQTPNDAFLRGCASYTYAMCLPESLQAQNIINQIGQAKPSISNPANQSVLVGASASFTVSVVSPISYTLQWYRNGILIPGATSLTYTLTNAQLTDSGSTFSATATSASGSVSSASATLTVTQNIVGYYYYGSIDYAADLLASNDDVPYLGTFPITSGQPLNITLPSAAANTFMVFKYPNTESTKTTYTNLPLNTGVIPSIAWNAVIVIGSFKYIFTRAGNTFGLNSVNPLIFS